LQVSEFRPAIGEGRDAIARPASDMSEPLRSSRSERVAKDEIG
jgi:hypothetical protein